MSLPLILPAGKRISRGEQLLAVALTAAVALAAVALSAGVTLATAIGGSGVFVILGASRPKLEHQGEPPKRVSLDQQGSAETLSRHRQNKSTGKHSEEEGEKMP